MEKSCGAGEGLAVERIVQLDYFGKADGEKVIGYIFDSVAAGNV